jgi:phage shock protein A
MSNLKDKLTSAVTSHKGQNPQIEAAVQGITTDIEALETQMEQMLAQKPVNPADLENAANTTQALKIQVQALLSALGSGKSTPPTSSTPSKPAAT